MNKYTHIALNQDVQALAGYYTPLKEVRLKYDGREVLYVVGQAVIESSCCGTANYYYAIVPGYIVNWQKEKNETGLPVSEVEHVSDKEARTNIEKIIDEAEHVSQVEFW